MGNRATITLAGDDENTGRCIYLHWNGGLESVLAFLRAYDVVRKSTDPLVGELPQTDVIGRIATVMGAFFFEDHLSTVYVMPTGNTDHDNGDNGRYTIDPDTLEILDRQYVSDYQNGGRTIGDLSVEEHRRFLEIVRSTLAKWGNSSLAHRNKWVQHLENGYKEFVEEDQEEEKERPKSEQAYSQSAGTFAPDDPWEIHPDWSLEDWAFECADGDTRQGYVAWVNAQIESQCD